MCNVRGIGIDLCEIARMQRLLDENRPLRRMFTAEEQTYIHSKGAAAAQTMAGLFAAKEAVLKAAAAIGYELSEEDGEAVWRAFCEIAQRRAQIDARELDAIVAAAAMQVPPTYTLKSYVITSGNLTKAMATVVLVRDEMELEGTGAGDGPVDA